MKKVKIVEICHIVKKCDIVYEDRKCYLEYLKAIKKCFVLKCLEGEQNKQYHQKIIY